MKKNVGIVIAISLAFLFGSLVNLNLNKKESSKETAEALSLKYPYIAKRILIDSPNDTLMNFYPLNQSVITYVEKNKLDMGIYFKYLPTAVTFGINDHKEFVAASLLKLPAAIQAQHMIDNYEIGGEEKITITKASIDPGYGDLYENYGESMTVNELIKKSIQDSDNTAHRVLYNDVIGGSPTKFYNSLSIPPKTINGSAAITPENYSQILESLYFSSYLSFESSNKILELLTNIQEGANLRSDIPKNISIAQKIGIYEKSTDPNIRTYSDCGIFYLQKRNYSLCIMANGEKEEISKHVKQITNMIFEYVSEYENPRLKD